MTRNLLIASVVCGLSFMNAPTAPKTSSTTIIDAEIQLNRAQRQELRLIKQRQKRDEKVLEDLGIGNKDIRKLHSNERWEIRKQHEYQRRQLRIKWNDYN